jgi:ribose/xylose/arabinose/galactoside ABC-type transport system permease subunit
VSLVEPERDPGAEGATAGLPASPEGKFRQARSRFARTTNLQLIIGTALLYAAFAIPYSSQFATLDNTRNIAEQGSILLVVALGQMFALLIGGFDISVAANMGFVSVVAALMMTDYDTGITLAIVIGLAVAALIGLVNGLLIAALGVNPFAATLGMLTFLLGFGNVLSGGASVGSLPGDFRYFGAEDWGPIPSAVAIAALALALCGLILRRLRVGLYVYGIGGSTNASRLAGVPVVRYEILAYTLCGFLAGLAGIMLASRLSVGQAELGGGYDLLSIATAVIGGTVIGGGVGRLSGVVLGATLIQVLNTGMDIAGIGEYVHRMVTGSVIVIAALVGRADRLSLRSITRLARGAGIPGLLRSRSVHAER